MALRPLIVLVVLLSLVVGSPGFGCFGPKLFVAAGDSPENEVLYAMVTLYIQEKTGVESTRVEISAGQPPLAMIDENKADLVITAAGRPLDKTVFELGQLPVVVTGKRPAEDLQFTTVLPAISKLNRLLTTDDVAFLVESVKAGESAMAATRKFFMARRWI